MKPYVLFLILALGSIAINLFQVWTIPWYWTVFLFIAAAFSFWWRAHQENKKRNTPMPVYVTN